jgi:hypothetical protein
MATPFITNPNDPIVQQVRDYNVVLSDTGTFPNSKILSYLNQSAFPRIRGYLISARAQTSTGVGKMVFYEELSDLADPTIQATANTLVFQVMTNSIVKDMVYMIAARLAASWMTTMLAGQVPEQQKIASDLQKEAMADLKQLTSSPELTAAAAAAAKAASSAVVDKSPRIFMALDVNPTTYDPINNAVKPYPGAQEDGVANLWVNQYKVSAPVAVGDTPAVIMNKLLGAVRAYLAAAPAGTKFNLVIGPNEGPLITTSRVMQTTDSVGNPLTVIPSLQVNMGWMSFYAGQHDLIVSALFCTLELLNASGTLGIKGIVYGVMQNILQLDHPDYTLLSQKGPYSVLIDITPGNAGTAAVLKPGATNPTAAISDALYDSFYFKVTSVSGKTSQDGVLKYQVGNVAASSYGVPARVVKIPRGSTADDVVRLMADDMNLISKQLKVLPALRSPTQMQVAGNTVTAPGIRIVPYQLSVTEDKLVFDLLSAPPEVVFGAVPNTLVLATDFDGEPKSIVMDIVYHFPMGKAELALLQEPGGIVGARVAQPKLSNRMSQAFQDINYFNRGIF